tara:strand:+ start:2058 stop:2294 length:237 start_codon:yes stop_codon:yes gene_type:complete
MIYLIYDNEEDANARADKEGKRIGLSYWIHGVGSRRVLSPQPTAEGKWALNVTVYDLTEEEESSTVESFNSVIQSEEF